MKNEPTVKKSRKKLKKGQNLSKFKRFPSKAFLSLILDDMK